MIPLRTLAVLALLGLAAAAGPLYEDRRAGVTFSPPDGWIEVPTPPVPEDVEANDDAPVLVVTHEASDAGSDGTLGRLDTWLLRGSSLDAAAKEVIALMKDTWKGFELGEWRDLGSGRVFSGEISGGRAFGAIFASGPRHAAVILAGGPSTTDAELIRIAGTWLFIDPDPAAPLRIPPGWKATETTHYRIRFQDDDDFAREVGRHLEAISTELRRQLPLVAPDAARRTLDVRIFKNEREFEAYASANGVKGAEAYFSPAQNELVAHMDARSAERTFQVLYHEATHQYLRDVVGRKVRIPIWLDEGLAEYFYAGSFSGSSFSIGLNEARHREVKGADRLEPLADMMEMSRDEFYALDGAYAQGWSVVWFLMTEPKYRRVVPEYLEALRDLGDDEKAWAKAMENFTLEQLESDWKRSLER